MSGSHTPAGGAARLNTGVAHNTRGWNHWTGSKDNHAVRQQVGEHVASLFPVVRVVRADRGFLAEEHGMR